MRVKTSMKGIPALEKLRLLRVVFLTPQLPPPGGVKNPLKTSLRQPSDPCFPWAKLAFGPNLPFQASIECKRWKTKIFNSDASFSYKIDIGVVLTCANNTILYVRVLSMPPWTGLGRSIWVPFSHSNSTSELFVHSQNLFFHFRELSSINSHFFIFKHG